MTDVTLAKTTLFVAIADKQARQKIVEALSSYYSCSEFDELSSLLEAVGEAKPALIICHQSLVGETQSLVLSDIKAKSTDSKVLITGPSRPIEIQIVALKHGARGYFDQTLPLTKLHEALKIIFYGEVWVERHVISGLIDEIAEVPVISDEQRAGLESLSPKELEVSEQVSYGATNKMIAKSMNITERTVKAHLTTTFQKMGIPDRLSLAIFFRDLR